VESVLFTMLAEFFQLQPLLEKFLIFSGKISYGFAFGALEFNQIVLGHIVDIIAIN
jgi:hypothetical protein